MGEREAILGFFWGRRRRREEEEMDLVILYPRVLFNGRVFFL